MSVVRARWWRRNGRRLAVSLPGSRDKLGERRYWWLAFCLFSYLALLAGLAVLDQTGGAGGVLAGCALVLAAGAPTAARLRRDILDGPGVYAAISMLMFGITSLLWIGRPLTPAPIITQADVAKALLLVAGGLLAFGVGARLFGRAKIRQPLKIASDAAPSSFVLLGLLAISVLAAGVGISGRIIAFGSRSIVGGSVTAATSQPLALMMSLGSIAVLAAALVAFSLRRGYRLVLVMAVIEVAVGFVSGFKAGALIAIALIIAAYVVCVGRVPWRGIATVAVVFFVVLLPANAIYRDIRQPVPGYRAPGAWTLFVHKAKGYALFRFRLIDDVALIQTLTPSVYAYGNGSHYEYLPALIAVPRALWPDKPVLNESLEFSHTYWQIPPSLSTTTPMTQIGDLYRNFGYVGVGVGLFAWGLVVGGFGFFCRRWRSPRAELIYLFSLVTWIAYIELDLPELITTACKSMLVVIPAAWLVLPGRRGVAGYRWLGSRLPVLRSRTDLAGQSASTRA